MYAQEQCVLHSTIIGFECGTGKTVTSLGLVATSTTQKMSQAQDENSKVTYRPTLIICPAASIEVWHQDQQKFFSKTLVMHQFYGTAKSVSSARKSILIEGGSDQLNEFVKGLDPNDPKVSLSP
jgi:SNF2 family DNA or RNA helicase